MRWLRMAVQAVPMPLEASSRLSAGAPAGPKGKRCASLSRRAKNADNPVLGAMSAQLFSRFSRLVLRNRRDSTLNVGD